MRLGSSIAARAFAALDRSLGEPVRVLPRLASDYTEALPDPDRSVANTRAVVALTPKTGDFEGARHGTNINTGSRLSVRSASIWLSPSTYAAIGYEVREGDQIVMAERPDEPAYTVARNPIFSDRGDVTIYLVVDA